MSDELEPTSNEPVENEQHTDYSRPIEGQKDFENNPELRQQGRRRNRYRPVGVSGRPPEVVRELRAIALEQAERIKRLEEALVKSQDAKVTPNLFFPPPPPDCVPPSGYEYELKTISENEETGQGDKRSVWIKTVPNRGDDKKAPDPRYCVFCSKQTLVQTLKANANVCKMYAFDDIDDCPNAEQETQIRRLHIQHMEKMQSFKKSDNWQERRAYADHYALTATPRGPVKDEVAFRSSGRKDGENVSYSAAQMNEIRQKEYQAQCNAIVANRAR